MLTNLDKELAPGARNAIRVCLNVQPHERVTVISDRECTDIAASLVAEIEDVGAPYVRLVRKSALEHAFSVELARPRVVASELGDGAGALGAAFAAKDAVAGKS